jgi:hypothetical protein
VLICVPFYAEDREKILSYVLIQRLYQKSIKALRVNSDIEVEKVIDLEEHRVHYVENTSICLVHHGDVVEKEVIVRVFSTWEVHNLGIP